MKEVQGVRLLAISSKANIKLNPTMGPTFKFSYSEFTDYTEFCFAVHFSVFRSAFKLVGKKKGFGLAVGNIHSVDSEADAQGQKDST